MRSVFVGRRCVRQEVELGGDYGDDYVSITVTGGPWCKTEVTFGQRPGASPGDHSATIFLRTLQQLVYEEYEGEYCVRNRRGRILVCYDYLELLALVEECSEVEADLWGGIPAPTHWEDFHLPVGLSAAGRRAYDIITDFLIEHGLTFTGGGRTFYSPAEWESRQEPYGQGAVLIVTYDGGDVSDAFSRDSRNYPMFEQMNEALGRAGLYSQEETHWYSAIYET